ncbi:hypothetical protein REC12_08860 [Desulfosporosinus sp. PR]|uniref:hypothetical protein n=1 Tax=Candidatus Desulfosporosinus nitrosoreducens TaxID=3401928 RepID=UPI0027F8CAD3|nr:hypothetical protein [Desulfosporosinus sp. PR]MDQ7093699.1 hypothetical protein [Desulfosporosinus sp. PR]
MENSFHLENVVHFSSSSSMKDIAMVAGAGYSSLFKQYTIYQFEEQLFRLSQVESYIENSLNNMGFQALEEICSLMIKHRNREKGFSDSVDGDSCDVIGNQEILCHIHLCGVQILRNPYNTHDPLFGAVFYFRPGWQPNCMTELLVLGDEVLGYQDYSDMAANIIWHARRSMLC